MPTPDTEPIACHLEAMTPSQRQRYEALKIRLRAAIHTIEELEDGFGFDFTPDPTLLMDVAEFVSHESLCCPFYTFTIRLAPHGRTMRMEITGPVAAKAIIKDALTP